MPGASSTSYADQQAEQERIAWVKERVATLVESKRCGDPAVLHQTVQEIRGQLPVIVMHIPAWLRGGDHAVTAAVAILEALAEFILPELQMESNIIDPLRMLAEEFHNHKIRAQAAELASRLTRPVEFPAPVGNYQESLYLPPADGVPSERRKDFQLGIAKSLKRAFKGSVAFAIRGEGDHDQWLICTSKKPIDDAIKHRIIGVVGECYESFQHKIAAEKKEAAQKRQGKERTVSRGYVEEKHGTILGHTDAGQKPPGTYQPCLSFLKPSSMLLAHSRHLGPIAMYNEALFSARLGKYKQEKEEKKAQEASKKQRRSNEDERSFIRKGVDMIRGSFLRSGN
ncbi:unnamed protein product [Vitrella brassicaformis CCMP3155]|uniref:Uncharacterized protein n=1 Tax=Vitrella brassicaformis (strain CCMP3155) TaxID=1169540 RepID=A0A0G4EE93_VITBC|nr:unnamed protein product [Vitrella brassicaformis CCMP3155]|mmetsp:Transcript_7243/g.17620  ORF Transcript_7243/g.17620 Transcript_7243/m.17620 type:complete len:341 (+) Transcript_7243:126-1148(+)|eukprot:CEL93874.1 unnamed protein product [Vitrella brassicaformis CCMP3155]